MDMYGQSTDTRTCVLVSNKKLRTRTGCQRCKQVCSVIPRCWWRKLTVSCITNVRRTGRDVRAVSSSTALVITQSHSLARTAIISIQHARQAQAKRVLQSVKKPCNKATRPQALDHHRLLKSPCFDQLRIDSATRWTFSLISLLEWQST
jgi:hypothetical protein